MTDSQLINAIFDKIQIEITDDQRVKNIRASGRSANSFRQDISENDFEAEGVLWGADYLYYQEHGRGPGKWPPVAPIRRWVQSGKMGPIDISVDSMTFLVRRKIGQEGTDIFLGKRPGLDLTGIIKRNMLDLVKQVRKNKLVEFESRIVDMFDFGE